jgi:hypothetical protein
MKLTIGMACYDDYDGVWFTIQSILMYHRECIDDINFVVVDGNPESTHGKACEKLVSKLKNKHGNNALYVKNISWQGTASRDYIFQYASTPYVLVLDSHVQVAPGSITRLIKFYDENPDCSDLIQGPLLDDTGELFATEMQPVWDYNMYGKWLCDPKKLESGEPYEVDMMGLGLFSCTRKNWLGFNQKFKGFGGEEGYLHRKYKKAGNRTVIQPWLMWNHRFDRPRGVPYPNEYIDRVRNYLIGWNELGDSVDEIIEYYSIENTEPGQERPAISASDLKQLNNQISNVGSSKLTEKSVEQDNNKSELISSLKSRVIELEMKLMEHQFAPTDSESVQTVEIQSFLEEFNQTHEQPPPSEQDGLVVEIPDNETSNIMEKPPEKETRLEDIHADFQQRLFQQPIQEEFLNKPAEPPPVPVTN